MAGKSNLLVTSVVVLLWYASNILVLLGNKYLLANSGFRQPVFLTLCHMTACCLLGLAIAVSGVMPAKPIKSRLQMLKVAFLAAIFCLTIVLGNASLKYIPVSFNQAIGSTTPFFTAIFAFFLQGSKENILTYCALVPVIGGVVVASGGEPLFHSIGFIFCMLATSGRALKSVVQSMLMTEPAEKLDPMSLLLYMSGASVAFLIPATFILEADALHQANLAAAKTPNFVWWLALNSLFAYLTNLLNFMVTKYTSALTLQVLGNAKGVVAAIISVMVFSNPVTAQGAAGYGITVIGVFLYSETKRRTKEAAKERAAAKDEEQTLMPKEAFRGQAGA